MWDNIGNQGEAQLRIEIELLSGQRSIVRSKLNYDDKLRKVDDWKLLTVPKEDVLTWPSENIAVSQFLASVEWSVFTHVISNLVFSRKQKKTFAWQ